MEKTYPLIHRNDPQHVQAISDALSREFATGIPKWKIWKGYKATSDRYKRAILSATQRYLENPVENKIQEFSVQRTRRRQSDEIIEEQLRKHIKNPARRRILGERIRHVYNPVRQFRRRIFPMTPLGEDDIALLRTLQDTQINHTQLKSGETSWMLYTRYDHTNKDWKFYIVKKGFISEYAPSLTQLRRNFHTWARASSRWSALLLDHFLPHPQENVAFFISFIFTGRTATFPHRDPALITGNIIIPGRQRIQQQTTLSTEYLFSQKYSTPNKIDEQMYDDNPSGYQAHKQIIPYYTLTAHAHETLHRTPFHQQFQKQIGRPNTDLLLGIDIMNHHTGNDPHKLQFQKTKNLLAPDFIVKNGTIIYDRAHQRAHQRAFQQKMQL